jgi:hypothetical protein
LGHIKARLRKYEKKEQSNTLSSYPKHKDKKKWRSPSQEEVVKHLDGADRILVVVGGIGASLCIGSVIPKPPVSGE